MSQCLGINLNAQNAQGIIDTILIITKAAEARLETCKRTAADILDDPQKRPS